VNGIASSSIAGMGAVVFLPARKQKMSFKCKKNFHKSEQKQTTGK
jgi:hypothetical protein